MASRETIVLYTPVDPRDLGPGHIDIHLFPAGASAGSPAHALTAALPIRSNEGIARAHLTYPVHGAPQLQVAPGMITVGSVQRSTLNLFCMGGQATLQNDASLSTVSIVSEAPILIFSKSMYDDDMEPVDLLVDELEAWLSILRARARGRVSAFERALLRIPPFQLYVQGLVLAARRLGEIAVDERSDFYWRSSAALHAALTAAKRRPNFPDPMPDFEALLNV
jgi:hypothetical protein